EHRDRAQQSRDGMADAEVVLDRRQQWADADELRAQRQRGQEQRDEERAAPHARARRRSRRRCARATPSARRAHRLRDAGNARTRRAPRTPPCRGTARRRGTTASPRDPGTGRTPRSRAPAVTTPQARASARARVPLPLLLPSYGRPGRMTFAAPSAVAVDGQAATTGFEIRPRPSISIAISSPGCSHTGGSRNAPTPAGVPVMIRSPGSSVIACETNDTTSATPKIMFEVLESCITSPFRIALT